MPLFLGYESAIEMLCYLRTRDHDTAEWCVPCTKTLPRGAIHGKQGIATMDDEARELLGQLDFLREHLPVLVFLRLDEFPQEMLRLDVQGDGAVVVYGHRTEISAQK